MLRNGAAESEVVISWQVDQMEAVEKGLSTEAQRFFVLTQTDNMWKEHLQVCHTCVSGILRSTCQVGLALPTFTIQVPSM